jgi:folate-dependent phosphoribosylglycinamide formyltransferase PurN
MVQTRIAVLTSVPELGFWLGRWWNNPIPDVDLVQVICNRGIMRSDQFPVRMLKREDFSSPERFESAILDELMPRRVDYVVAWEFDLPLSASILEVFPRKWLSLGPSLSPQHGPSENAYFEILRSKPLESGVTLHELGGETNSKIIAQKKFMLEKDESLFSLKEKTRKAGMELVLDYFIALHKDDVNAI